MKKDRPSLSLMHQKEEGKRNVCNNKKARD